MFRMPQAEERCEGRPCQQGWLHISGGGQVTGRPVAGAAPFGADVRWGEPGRRQCAPLIDARENWS